MLNFLRSKKKNSRWERLSDTQKQLVASKLKNMILAMSGPRYKIVSGSDQYQREQGIVEQHGEDYILNHYQRGKLLDLARNAVRNNSTFNTILNQFNFNSVGSEGGKVVITFADKDYSKEVREEFASWTRQCDFYDGLNLNTILKIILKTQLIGGDCVLLFDDNVISDSGRILVYEPDEIGNTTENALFERYGRNSTQSEGRIYNGLGQFIGVCISKSQRGQPVFNPQQSYLLKRDPNGNYLDELWLMPRNIWRVAQGRGVTPASSSLATLIDLNDYIGFELAASKKNSQTLAVVNQEKQDDSIEQTAFDTSDLDVNNMTDEQIKELLETVQNEEPAKMTLDQIKSAGTIYQVMPEGYKLELLDTKHPNVNSIEFVRWLADSAGASFGLGSCFSSLSVKSSYSGFKGEQLLSQPAFEEAQHNLEQVCDWIFYRWTRWALRKGIIQNKFPDYFMRSVTWQWPRMKDIDQVKEQNAITLKLKNNTSSLREILGSDWQEKLLEISEEIQFCKEHNIPHPALQTVSGQIITTDTDQETLDNEQK